MVESTSQKAVFRKRLALMPADTTLEGPTVVSKWACPKGSVKKIEQVGSGYEKLKMKYAAMWNKVKNGASA